MHNKTDSEHCVLRPIKTQSRTQNIKEFFLQKFRRLACCIHWMHALYIAYIIIITTTTTDYLFVILLFAFK